MTYDLAPLKERIAAQQDREDREMKPPSRDIQMLFAFFDAWAKEAGPQPLRAQIERLLTARLLP